MPNETYKNKHGFRSVVQKAPGGEFVLALWDWEGGIMGKVLIGVFVVAILLIYLHFSNQQPSQTQNVGANNSGQVAQIANSPNAKVNFQPPERQLNEWQRINLIRELKKRGTFSVALRNVGTQESQQYCNEFKEALINAGWTIGTAKFLIQEDQISGVYILVGDIAHPPNGAIDLQSALKTIGIVAPGYAAPIGPEELDLSIGFQEKSANK